MLEPTRFLDILKHFILFWQDTPEDKKNLAGYHQYILLCAKRWNPQQLGKSTDRQSDDCCLLPPHRNGYLSQDLGVSPRLDGENQGCNDLWQQ